MKYIISKNKLLIIPLLTGLFFVAGPFFSNATVQDDITQKNKQIDDLNKQIEDYQQQIETVSGQSKTLSGEITILNAKISQIRNEIKSLSISISEAGSEIDQTVSEIKDAEAKISTHLAALASALRILNQAEQQNLVEIILKNNNLSDFFSNLNYLQNTQENLKLTIDEIKKTKSELEDKESQLEDQKKELEGLKNIQQIEKKSAEQTRSEKNSLLKETKGQESKFQSLIKQSQADIQKIQAQIFYLQQNGVSAEEAVKFGQLAAIGVGIRPAFLLGILEVESGLGKNIGTGNWLDDMYQCYLRLKKPEKAEQEKNAFLAIVGKLGLDPETVKVSREPNYGCGGALGPAQFLPSTWLGYEGDVARLTGHRPPNPWHVEDAFTASALKLAKAGADQKTKAAETAAAKTYLSGKPNCSTRTCNYYAKAVLIKAAEIEQAMR